MRTLTLRVSDLQSDSDMDSIRNSCDVYSKRSFPPVDYVDQRMSLKLLWKVEETWQYDMGEGGEGQYWEYSQMESSAERGLSEGEAECRRKGEALKANYICPWNTENSGSQWNENRNSVKFFKNQTLPSDGSNALPVSLIHFPLSRFLWLLTVLMKAREKDSNN